jgi:DNA-nicking Smr family endonuclease
MARDEDDLALWRRVAESVTPLKRKRGFVPKAPAAAPAPAGPPAAHHPAPAGGLTQPKPQRRHVPAAPAAPPPPPVPPVLQHGHVAGIDAGTIRRLRRGQLPIEAALDLHGHRQDDAHRALIGFVGAHQAAGRRLVLVVTGKGLRGDRSGVLRRQVPLWLNAPPLRDKILAFDYARPEHGGTGALYILLKRQRHRAGDSVESGR